MNRVEVSFCGIFKGFTMIHERARNWTNRAYLNHEHLGNRGVIKRVKRVMKMIRIVQGYRVVVVRIFNNSGNIKQ